MIVSALQSACAMQLLSNEAIGSAASETALYRKQVENLHFLTALAVGSAIGTCEVFQDIGKRLTGLFKPFYDYT